MIFHVVHAAECPRTLLAVGVLPRALDGRVVLGLVSGTVLASRETLLASLHGVLGGLRALLVAAEESLEVLAVVSSEIATSGEHGGGFAAREGADAGRGEVRLGDVLV